MRTNSDRIIRLWRKMPHMYYLHKFLQDDIAKVEKLVIKKGRALGKSELSELSIPYNVLRRINR